MPLSGVSAHWKTKEDSRPIGLLPSWIARTIDLCSLLTLSKATADDNDKQNEKHQNRTGASKRTTNVTTAKTVQCIAPPED